MGSSPEYRKIQFVSMLRRGYKIRSVDAVCEHHHHLF